MAGNNDGPLNNVTTLLIEWRRGDQRALDAMIPLIYDELRRLARARVAAEGSGRAMQATALVHEVYVRLVDAKAVPAQSREHFLAIASRLMRQILVDDARRRRALKRGVDAAAVEISSVDVAQDLPPVDMLALDRALDELAALDPRQRDMVEMKFFGGLTIAEISAALGVSHATVERDWTLAKAFLFARLRQ